MDDFLTIAPLVVTLIGVIYFARKKMQKLGILYVIVFYLKWFLGVVITAFAFYALFLSSDWFKEMGYPAVLSLGIGAFVWFVPMNYVSKYLARLEKKYKKETSEE